MLSKYYVHTVGVQKRERGVTNNFAKSTAVYFYRSPDDVSPSLLTCQLEKAKAMYGGTERAAIYVGSCCVLAATGWLLVSCCRPRDVG